MATATEELCPKKFTLGRRRTRQEMLLGLTPSAVYMLHYWIQPILRNTANGWASLNIADFASRPGSPCLRSCREAYNRIYAAQHQLGLTLVHNHDQVPKIYVCLTRWLDTNPDSDRLPLFFKQNGQHRHLRDRHERPDMPLSVNAQLYLDRRRGRRIVSPHKNHDANPALILYPSVLQKQTEKAFQSSPRQKTGPASEMGGLKLVGWIRSRCAEALPSFYGFAWSDKARYMVSGYIRNALLAAHDKQDIIDCFVSTAEALFRLKISGADAGYVAVKASELIKTYTARGSSPEARLAAFARRKQAENISSAQADANEILRLLASYQKTKLVDFTSLSFLTLAVFKDIPAKLYLFQRLSPHGRRFLYKVHCNILRDLFFKSRFHQQKFEFTHAAVA